MAAYGYPIEKALILSMESSLECYAARMNGELICMFGMTPLSMIGGVGSPWMLGTDRLEHYAIPFVRHCREVVLDMEKGYEYLYNYVDARNKTSIRWLKWLGFNILEARPYGHLGLPFHKFEKRVA